MLKVLPAYISLKHLAQRHKDTKTERQKDKTTRKCQEVIFFLAGISA